MNRIVDISIIKASRDDVSEILALQKIAYQSEAMQYDDWTIPPLTQTIFEMEAEFGIYVFLKTVVQERIVGSVRGSLNSGTCSIGRLIVHPDYQRKGIGTALMKSIEKAFIGAARFELFTGTKSIDNIRFYRRLGYEGFREEDLTSEVRLLFMEKNSDNLQKAGTR
jgi:GNAT superfamily N-acetyltransferase